MKCYPENWLTLTRDFGEAQIAMKCLNLTKIPCLISSPFREDNKPSFSIYEKNNKIYFKDFATGDFGDLELLLCNLFNCDNLTIVDSLLHSKELQKVDNKGFIKNTSTNKIVKIKSTERPWRDYDIRWWECYGISKKWLEFANVHPISYFFINDKIYKTDKFAYTYIEHKDGIETQKIYQPLNHNGMKWISSANSSVWSLWNQLPDKGDNLIITSSLKDALTIWANTGIPSCSLQSESIVPKKNVINELKNRFFNIFVMFDNDFDKRENHGRKFGNRICNIFGLKQIETPTGTAKDPSDYRALSSKKEFNKLIFNLINNGKTRKEECG